MKKITKKILDTLAKTYNKKLSKKEEVECKKELLKGLNVFIKEKAILGIDIYKYSQFKTIEQAFVPHLFKKLLNISFDNCYSSEPYLFQNLDKDELKNNFIDTGDGGFLIFENPLQAIIFSLYFQANIKRYNSGHSITQNLRNIIGTITLRYCLTFDDIYKYEDNHYGSGIINNARILAKDKLNRFLLDSNSIDWFERELNGIENFMVIEAKTDFQDIELFKDYKEVLNNKDELSLMFLKSRANFLSTDVLHIGEIKSKTDVLNIFSVHIQIKVTSGGIKKFNIYTVSLGNLNSLGLQ